MLFALLLVGASAIYVSTGGNLFLVGGNFSPVWCNVYDWMACGNHIDATQQITVSAPFMGTPQTFRCTADRCDFTSTSTNPGALYKNGNRNVPLTVPFSLLTNDVLSTDGGSTTLTYNVVNQRLVWCGGAACDAATTGRPVIGANRCTFITDKNIYGPLGQLLQTPSNGQISYTIPPGTADLFWTGEQFICGNQYAECTTNADCRPGHTYTYNYNGQILGAEASNGQLQIYGCNSVGSQPSQSQLDYLPSIEQQPGSTAFSYGNRCQVIATQNVQCIPGSTTCGANAVCDVNTFTCKPTGTVQCSTDAQCGAGQVYDQATKSFVHYACQNPSTPSSSCQRIVDRTVQCFYNSECATGYYCSADYTCLQQAPVKTQCPIACCENDPRYFDKPAPLGQVCCPGGMATAPTLAQCGGGNGGGGNNQDTTSYTALIFAALMGLLGFALFRKRDLVLAVAAGAIFAVLTYSILAFILNNWLLVLIGSIVGGALILWLFGGAIIAIVFALLIRGGGKK